MSKHEKKDEKPTATEAKSRPLTEEEARKAAGGYYSQAQYDSYERMGMTNRSNWPSGAGE